MIEGILVAEIYKTFHGIRSSTAFEKYPELRQHLFDLLLLSTAGQQPCSSLHSLLCCMPQVEVPSELG